MTPGHYVLSKKLFSISGDYTLTDAAGATVMTFDGKLRIALRFHAIDAEGRRLFTGQGRIISVEHRVDFECAGQPCATMYAEWEGGLRHDGPQKCRYVVTCANGDALDTSGDVSTTWSVRRRGIDVARVERRRRGASITLLDAANGAFVMSVVMAVTHLTLGDERTFGDG